MPSEAYLRPVDPGRFPQFPQGGYVTPGSSRSNSSSSLYPGPVYGTPIVPSPLVPSRPRSKTPDSRPSTGQSNNAHAWQAGVSTSASGSSTCMFPRSHPSLPNPSSPSLFSHLQMVPSHRPPGHKPALHASTCTQCYRSHVYTMPPSLTI